MLNPMPTIIPEGPAEVGAPQTILMIGGVPRSGTTMLSALIQRELNIAVAPETHFFDMALRRGVAKLPPEVQNDLRIMAAYEGLDLTCSDPVESFRIVLDRLLPGRAQVIAEKTPDHLMSFGRLLAASPDFKAIVIVRSCAEVCNSLARMPWNLRSPRQNTTLWVKYYLQSVRLKRRFPSRVAIVEYERICDRPREEIARLAEELGLPRCQTTAAANVNYDVNLEPWKRDANGPVRRAERTGTPTLSVSQRLFAQIADRALRVTAPIPNPE